LPSVEAIDAHLAADPARREPHVASALARLRVTAVRGRALRALVEERLAARAPLSDLDLAGADLAGRDHRNAALPRARLAGASLRGAVLAGLDLAGAVLRGADLTAADLIGCVLDRADLHAAIL